MRRVFGVCLLAPKVIPSSQLKPSPHFLAISCCSLKPANIKLRSEFGKQFLPHHLDEL